MEPRLMADLGGVRVHTGPAAAAMSREIDARAFAIGGDIYYGASRSPANDSLTAHELAHAAQQPDAREAGTIHRTPETAAPDAAPAADPAATLIADASAAIQAGGGKAPFHYAYAELDSDAVFVLFDDYSVHRIFRRLLKDWLGATGVDAGLENTTYGGAPRWVGEFRARALNLRPTDTPTPEWLHERQMADLAIELADSVAEETPVQKIRRQFVEEIDRRIGTTIMSQEAIDNERTKAASGGYTPQNFTTCIEFFGQVTRDVAQAAGIDSPLLHGPNHYKEINKQAKASLPPGAWHPCTPNMAGRPRPGDMIILTFAQDVKDASGGLKYGKGWFAHISILRSIERPADGSTTERWISVDGGGTTVKEVVRAFDPATCLITGPGTTVRTLHGWIDIEKAAEAKLVKTP